MYNPNALVQTLETASMVEQNLLDSLRGPDAAHRITDEQIRAIITSPSFKPRYGRPYYYDVFYTRETWIHSSSSVHTTHNTTT